MPNNFKKNKRKKGKGVCEMITTYKGLYNMKRYKVMTRRNASERWTEWTTTSDINKVLEQVDVIKGNGWEYRVSDEGVDELLNGGLLEKVTNHIRGLITKYKGKRDTHKDIWDAIFFATCNGKIAVLEELEKLIRKADYEN